MNSLPLGSSYLLHEPIGRGAMGQVWRGSTVPNGAEVAIKVLRSELAEDPDVVARFHREGSIMVAIRHPCVVGIREVVVQGETLAIVMDLITGGDLRSYLGRLETLRPSEALRLVGQVCAGLATVHGAGVLHRDLKPENILIDVTGSRGPVARLTDFGIGRFADGPSITKVTGLIGTPRYLAPEVIEGGRASVFSDLYSVGIVLYELLSGKVPFSGHHPVAVLRAHVEDKPERPSGLADDVWGLVAQLLEKDPARRPASAADVARECAALALTYRGSPALQPRPSLNQAEQDTYVPATSQATDLGLANLHGLLDKGFLDDPVAFGDPAPAPETVGHEKDGNILPREVLAAPRIDLNPSVVGGDSNQSFKIPPTKRTRKTGFVVALAAATLLALIVVWNLPANSPEAGTPVQPVNRTLEDFQAAFGAVAPVELSPLTPRTQLLAVTSRESYMTQISAADAAPSVQAWAQTFDLPLPVSPAGEDDGDMQDRPEFLAGYPHFPKLFRQEELMKVIERPDRTFLVYGVPQRTEEFEYFPPQTILFVSIAPDSGAVEYVLDLSSYQTLATETKPGQSTAVRWAEQTDDLLLLDTNRGVIAFDLDAKQVLWRSDPIASGSGNILVHDGVLVSAEGSCDCDAILSYGMYVSDLKTGAVLQAEGLPSPPVWLAIKDSRLYVHGDKDYVYQLDTEGQV